ncbi:MAG: hypothetical protein H6709_08170 [Kofleriaceae bacterium]|nr:hypothetical protein [Kofleriaceae bacterium]
MRRGAARRGAGHQALAFTGTHDQLRIATVTGDAALARLGLVAVALGAAVPLLYYGDEVGLAADDATPRDFEDSWPDRQPMPWDPARWDRATSTRSPARCACAAAATSCAAATRRCSRSTTTWCSSAASSAPSASTWSCTAARRRAR